jgi:uncharacterized repeat protein (TIGR03803 family)
MRNRASQLKPVAFAMAVVCIFLIGTLSAQSVTELHLFANSPDGGFPSGALVQGRDGSLYGTTEQGGINTCTETGATTGCGTVFKIDLAGNLTKIHDFNGADGEVPHGLVLASDGYFYGVGIRGGANGFGVLYRISPGGNNFTVLHHFTGGTDGKYPSNTLLQATDGNLYGFSMTGLYRASLSGTVATIYTLATATDSTGAPVIQDADGNLYAIMSIGFSNGTRSPCGAIAKFNRQGVLMSEHDFSCGNTTYGEFPYSAVTQAANGYFYGTTTNGGSAGKGTAFALNPQTNTVTVLHNYDSTEEYPYAGLTLGSDGDFYGATWTGTLSISGTIDQITPGGFFTELAALPNHGEDFPYAKLIQHTSGKFFGEVTYAGQVPDLYGSLYSFDNGLGPFITFVRAQGRDGSTVQILGQGLRGASAITFGGVPATSFNVISDTYMTVVVPAHPNSGTVTVTTPAGTLNSNVPFIAFH